MKLLRTMGRGRKTSVLSQALMLTLCISTAANVLADVTPEQLQPLRALREGDASGVAQASKLAKELAKRNDLNALTVLRAMKGASPLGKNWLLGVANAAQNKQPATNQDLERFLADLSQDGEARYTVFRWLTDKDETAKNKFLDAMLEDPSLELRYEAVARSLSPKDLDETTLKRLLDVARQPEQVTEIIERLGKSGIKVDQSKHFGFLSSWKFIGPFDNTGSASFNKAYPVEADWVANKLADSYEGKSGATKWISEASEDPNGLVDLAKLYNNEKGCVVYGVTEVDSSKALDCELRVGCINAQKVWLNSELVISNEVYHTGMQVDQYIAPIKLKAGKNRILIKICQNEQKEAWAQRYVFQARICDSSGKAIQ